MILTIWCVFLVACLLLLVAGGIVLRSPSEADRPIQFPKGNARLDPPKMEFTAKAAMRCDCCGEWWETDFFCKQCSQQASMERLGDEEDGGYSMDVCANCCNCHLKGLYPVGDGTTADDSQDIPF